MKALNEVESIVQKAARGAGIPLGQAEDLGRVAQYLAGTGGDLALITTALKEPLVPVDVEWGVHALEIHAGAVALVGPVVRDAFHMGINLAVLPQPDHAALVGAYLVQGGIGVSVDDCRVSRKVDVTPKTPRGPVEIADPLWQVWAALAARTYVPESDASRTAGAGAGLTDND